MPATSGSARRSTAQCCTSSRMAAKASSFLPVVVECRCSGRTPLDWRLRPLRVRRSSRPNLWCRCLRFRLCLGLVRSAGRVASLCAVPLDHLLHLLLSLVPVIRVKANQVDAERAGDLAQSIKALLVVDEANAHADAAESTRAANTVEVRLGIRLAVASSLHGDIIVDDHGDAGHVNAAGENIGRDQDFIFAVAELGKQIVSLIAIESGMQRRDLVAISDHAALNLVGAFACLCSPD